MTNGLKNFVWSLVFTTGEVNEFGQPIPRTSYPKSVYRGCVELKKALLDNLEISWVKKDVKEPKENDLIWADFKQPPQPENDYKKPPNVFLRERFKQTDVVFDTKMKDAVKFYFNATSEYVELAPEVIDEFEKEFDVKFV